MASKIPIPSDEPYKSAAISLARNITLARLSPAERPNLYQLDTLLSRVKTAQEHLPRREFAAFWKWADNSIEIIRRNWFHASQDGARRKMRDHELFTGVSNGTRSQRGAYGAHSRRRAVK